jgi:ferredoxin-NADP reductase
MKQASDTRVARIVSRRAPERGERGAIGVERQSTDAGGGTAHLLHGDVLDIGAAENDVVVDLHAGRDLRAFLLAAFGAERSHCKNR